MSFLVDFCIKPLVSFPPQVLFFGLCIFTITRIFIPSLFSEKSLFSGCYALMALGLFFVATVISPCDLAYFEWLLTLSALCIVLILFSVPSVRNMLGFEFWVLFYTAVLGGTFALRAENLMTVFLALELQALSLYLLVLFPSNKDRNFEAPLKYFILGGVATSVLLFGITFVYGSVSSLSFSDIFAWIEMKKAVFGPDFFLSEPGLFFGILLMLAGLFFKLSAVPFHAWTPDIYQSSQTIVVLFLATCSKVVALGILSRVIVDVLQGIDISMIVRIVSLSTMILGSLCALRQTDIKRFLGYSTIAHMGYMLGFYMAGAFGSDFLIIYLSMYILTVIFVLFCVLWHEEKYSKKMLFENFAGLGATKPVLSFFLAGGFLSLAGIPPMPLFFGKLGLLFVLVQLSEWFLIGGVVVSSLLGAFYYLRFVKILYFDTRSTEKPLKVVPAPLS